MLAVQASVYLSVYSKNLEDRKALSVHIYYTWCNLILIFKLHIRTWFTPRSSIHSLKIRMTSHSCKNMDI